MTIFHGVTLDSSNFIVEAAQAISRKRESLGLQAPWSLAELSPSQDDFKFILVALRQASEGSIERWLRPHWQIEFGIVFLLFASETARRFASEGEVWSVVAKCFPERSKRLLFSQNNQPTQRLKDAIERAARHFGLRHVFGTAGVQGWYQTIYLQFGFTIRGGKSRLPEWLVGQNPSESVCALLNDSRLSSLSFKKLWQLLRDFRRNNISEVQARNFLTQSPWVVQSFVSDLLKASRQRLDLPDRPTGDFTEEPEIRFFSPPWLDWSESSPRFLSDVANLSQLFNLSGNVYDLKIGNKTVAILTRQADESYRVDSDPVILPNKPVLSVRVESRESGETRYSQILELWDKDEDLTLFSASGKRLDAWNEKLDSQRAYYLLASADLTLVPETNWHFVDHDRKLHALPAGWSSELKLTFDDGDTLWTPLLGGFAPRRIEPAWASGCRVAIEKINGKSVRFQVVVQTGVEVRFVRCGVPLDNQNGYFSLPLSTFSKNGNARIRLGLRFGEEICNLQRTISIEETLRDPLALILSENGWQRVEGEDILVSEARKRSYRFSLPRAWRGDETPFEDWVLMEGDVFVGRIPRRPYPIRNLAGYGAKLTLRHRLYNVGEGASTISFKVIEQGAVARFLTNDSGSMELELCQPVEPDEGHKIITLSQNGELECQNPIWNPENPSQWFFETPQESEKLVSVAVAFRGEWFGGWCRKRADAWLPYLLASEQFEPDVKAGLLRWFHLPLLSRRYESEVQTFIEKYPVQTLSAWLRNVAVQLPFSLRFGDRDEGWFSVVRKFYRGWLPSNQDVQVLFQIWMDRANTPMEAIGEVFDALLRIDPMLAVKTIQLGSRNHAGLLRLRITGAGNEATFMRHKRELTESCALEMGCDVGFLQSLFRKAVSQFRTGEVLLGRDAVNLATAVAASSDFRNLLAIHLFESIT